MRIYLNYSLLKGLSLLKKNRAIFVVFYPIHFFKLWMFI